MIKSTCAVLLVGLSAACTGAELYVDQSRLPEPLREDSEAQICTPPALKDDVPYKLLFIIDTSGSTATTDPGTPPRREKAVEDAINANIDKTNVSYGVITFSDEPVRQTFGYTRDTTVLAGALANVASSQGGTNYSNTLWEVIDFVQADFASLSPSEAARTHYLFYWLSDGFPTVGVVDPAAITPGVTQLCATYGPKVAQMSFNTAFLGSPATSADETAAAESLLTQMAAQCPGAFINIPNGNSFSFSVDTQPIVTKYELALYVASNMNVRLGQYLPEPDSDGDGILDSDEPHIGTDATNMDTDNDGVRDGIEQMVAPLRSPTVPDGTCPNPGVDTDDDGLYDCEEIVLGTGPSTVDTDGDLLPDGIEALTGGEPLKADPTADTDLDGYLDSMETKAHLPVQSATSADDASHWGYTYALNPIDTPAGVADPADTACFGLTVNNITMRQTLATKITAAGTNHVEVWAVFRPVDQKSAAPVFFRAVRNLTVIEPDTENPPSGVINLTPADFTEVGNSAVNDAGG